MKTVRLFLTAALAAALVTGCKNARPVTTSAEQPRATSFPHSKHSSMECADCHAEVAASTRLGAAPLPGPAKCEECHDAKASDAPAQAMRDLKPKDQTVYQITFNHAEHLKKLPAKDACARCHEEKRLPEPGAARDWTPEMSTCTSCHHHQQEVAAASCQPCHVSLRAFPLKPIEALAGFSHQGNFVKEHRDLAKNSAATCAQCHDQTYCANCHANATVPVRPEIRFPERIEANFIHRADYVSRHQIDASADPASCRKCHGSYFCESCHREQGVATYFGSTKTARDPHPAGWTAKDAHGRAARNNIVSCSGCHDQGAASICVQCHRVGGIGGNPHPSGYASKHSSSDIQKNSMCRVCHVNG
jgi:hypothetical protein